MSEVGVQALQVLIAEGKKELANRGSMDWELMDQAIIVLFKDAGVELSDFKGALSHDSARRWFAYSNPLLADKTHIPVVYFISTDDGRLVKIGTTRHLKARYAALVSAMPTALRFEAVMPGSFREEQALHKRFESARVRGEWFNRTAEVDELIRLVTLLPSLTPVMGCSPRLALSI